MSQKYRLTAFFNGVNSFKTAFPQLADATIEWRERRGPEDTSSADLRKTGFRRGNFTAGVLPCSNPGCHEGGYEVDKLLAFMLRYEETEREGLLLCAGREVAEEARRGPVRCPHRIEFKASLSQRAEDARVEERPQQRKGRGRGPRRSFGQKQRQRPVPA